MSNRTILITGASAGIGAQMAREYASRGWDLILTARREAPMQKIADELKAKHGTTTYIYLADQSEQSAAQDLKAKIEADGLQVDALVNNAGYGLPGVYLDHEWKAHQDSLQVMLNAPCELVAVFLPGMKERGFGRIINVASLAGHLPGSRGHTTYAAIKSFLIKFSQSLNMELEPYGVYVTALCPGFTITEFHDVNGTRAAINKLPGFMVMSAERCVRSGVNANEKNKSVHTPGNVNKFIAGLAKLLPNSVAMSIMAGNSEKFRKGE